MRNFTLAALAILLIFTGHAYCKEPEIADWPYLAEVAIKGAARRGAAQLLLTPDVIDAARPDLADIRLLVDGRDMIGYTSKISQGSIQRIPLPVNIYNRAHVPGQHCSATVDFGSKTMKTSVKIVTPGSDFRRKVRIEGSDDGENWSVVKDRSFIFRIGGAEKAGGRDVNVVSFPGNDFRRLKITVLNSDDDPSEIAIQDVEAWRQVETFPETTPVEILSSVTRQKKRITEVMLDLGYKNMPLDKLEMTFSDGNFFRGVRVLGRNEETRVVKTVVEDSPALEKTVEVPWTPVTTGAIHKFSSDGAVEASLRLDLRGSKHRYLLVEIDNRDNPPLRFESARATRLVQRIEFPVDRAGAYSLLVGLADARGPEYDVGHFLDRLKKSGVAEASLGKLVPNPAHKRAEKVLPWSERHKGIIWVALGLMAAALGFFIYRIAASAVKGSAQGAPPEGS
jgi:hypothetical protein